MLAGAAEDDTTTANSTEPSISYWTPQIQDAQYKAAAQGAFLLALLTSTQLVPGVPSADEGEVAHQLQVSVCLVSCLHRSQSQAGHIMHHREDG